MLNVITNPCIQSVNQTMHSKLKESPGGGSRMDVCGTSQRVWNQPTCVEPANMCGTSQRVWNQPTDSCQRLM